MTEIERECRKAWQDQIDFAARSLAAMSLFHAVVDCGCASDLTTQSEARTSLFDAIVECQTAGLDAEEVGEIFDHSFNELWQAGGFRRHGRSMDSKELKETFEHCCNEVWQSPQAS